MKTRTMWTGFLLAALAAGFLGADAGVAQELRGADLELSRISHVVVPQSRGFSLSRSRQRLTKGFSGVATKAPRHARSS